MPENISATASVDDSTTLLTEKQNNLLNIVKVHFIEKIHDDIHSSFVWKMIDTTKLEEGINELLDAFSCHNNDLQ
jgi:hypothetical protein